MKIRNYRKNPVTINRGKTDYNDLGFQKGYVFEILDSEFGDPTGHVAVVVSQHTLHVEGYGEGTASGLIKMIHNKDSVNGTKFFAIEHTDTTVWDIQQRKVAKLSKLKSA